MNRKLAAGLVVLSLIASAASAGTLRVPQDYGSLQLAIDAAGPGDTVLVRGGTHPGILVVNGKSDLVIRGKKSAVVSDLDVLDSAGVTIQGFVVEGSTRGAALYAWSSVDVVFRKCTIRDTAGDGIQADACRGLVVEKCRFDRIGNDGISFVGGGVALAVLRKNVMADVDGSGLSIGRGNDNLAEKNEVVRSGGCAYVVTDGAGNVLRKNRATDVQAGIQVRSPLGEAENRLEKNTITRPSEYGIRVDMPDELRTQTVGTTLAVSIDEPVDKRVSGSASGYLFMPFYGRPLGLSAFQGGGVLREVTLTVATDIAMTSRVSNPLPATTDTYWYQYLDADCGPLHLDADQQFHRNYGAPWGATHNEAWDYDVVASATERDDLAGFCDREVVVVDLLGETHLCSWWNPVDHDLTTWNGTIAVELRYTYVPDPAGTVLLAGNKVREAAGDGFLVATRGATLDGNKATGCGECGFHAELDGNTFEDNKASGSGGHDLVDEAGGNVYDGNRFGTESVVP